jgi:hypothetical protein
LVKRREYTTLDQKLHDVTRCDTECFGKLTNGRAFDETNLFERVCFTSSANLIEHAFFDRAKTRCILIALGKASATGIGFSFSSA